MSIKHQITCKNLFNHLTHLPPDGGVFPQRGIEYSPLKNSYLRAILSSECCAYITIRRNHSNCIVNEPLS